MLGFALTATFAFTSPEGAEAPIVIGPPPPEPTVVATEDTIVVTESGGPVVVVAAEPPPPPVVAPPPPPPPAPRQAPSKPLMGVGLMATGATMFILGLSSQIVTATDQANICKNWDRYGFNGVHGCFYYTEPWGTHSFTGFAFGSALVMTSIGAGALGQYDAWQSVFGDQRQRNARSRKIAGGVFALAGLGALIADGFLLRRELTNFCTTHECEVQRRALYYGLADGGSLALISGMAMLSYGNNYQRNRFKYGKHWSVTPQASPQMVGATAMMRF